MQDSITQYLDRPDVGAVRMTCFDLSKAFDPVLHDVLLIFCSIAMSNVVLLSG